MELRVRDRLADEEAVSRVLHAHDLYEVLQLPRDATAAQIKRAFHRLSKAVHPDKNGAPRANEGFDKLRTAQQTLADHASDKREYVYSREQLERAKTHDPLWNATHPLRGRSVREWARAGARRRRARGSAALSRARLRASADGRAPQRTSHAWSREM